MSIHISAKKGEIAKIVLMPGDPLRAKYIADSFLKDIKQVSSTRNAFYFTGTYKDKQVTIGASGMGCPSIGTCGAYSTDLKLFDLLNVENAVSESTFAKFAWGIEESIIPRQGKAFDMINYTAAAMNRPVQKTTVHSSDIFYRKEKGTPQIAVDNNCLAVEMEAFALFANAKYLNKTAATLLTVSDIIPTHEKISADQRERSLLPMMEVALESCLNLDL